MNTTTLQNRRPAPGNSASTAKVAAWLASIAKIAFGPMDAHAERAAKVRELLELADSYAETQPSFASDLRAAAMANLRAD